MFLKQRLLSRPKGLLAAIAISMFALPLTAAADGYTYEITTGSFMSGTVRYAAHGDTVPSSITLNIGTCTWTKADFTEGAYDAVWDGIQPQIIAAGSAKHENAAGFIRFYGGNYDHVLGEDCGVGGPNLLLGTYTITPHPNVVVPVMGPYGILALVSLLGVAAIRKIRA